MTFDMKEIRHIANTTGTSAAKVLLVASEEDTTENIIVASKIAEITGKPLASYLALVPEKDSSIAKGVDIDPIFRKKPEEVVDDINGYMLHKEQVEETEDAVEDPSNEDLFVELHQIRKRELEIMAELSARVSLVRLAKETDEEQQEFAAISSAARSGKITDELIVNTLKFFKGFREKTAKELRISTGYLRHKILIMKDNGIEVPDSPHKAQGLHGFKRVAPLAGAWIETGG